MIIVFYCLFNALAQNLFYLVHQRNDDSYYELDAVNKIHTHTFLSLHFTLVIIVDCAIWLNCLDD